MFKRKQRAPEVVTMCDVCGEPATVSGRHANGQWDLRRCERHAGLAFGKRDEVRGEYETRGDAR